MIRARGQWRAGLLMLAAIGAVLAMLALPPIPQDPVYHGFADTRGLFGIPNLGNVASNLPFALVGLWGVWRSRGLPSPLPRRQATVLTLGILLVCFGSAWYHLAPANLSLAWDRLPMTIAFMALLSLVVSERLSPALGLRLLWPLVLAGLASVAWWLAGEVRGAGDLRPYALVQFLSMVLIALLLLLYPQRHMAAARLWWALGVYALAKLAEHFDAELFAALGWISGHSIKHLLAAVSAWLIVAAACSWKAGAES